MKLFENLLTLVTLPILKFVYVHVRVSLIEFRGMIVIFFPVDKNHEIIASITIFLSHTILQAIVYVSKTQLF